MITLELTQDEYDTIWEALSSYKQDMKEQRYTTKDMNASNYFDAEYRLAEETLKKINGKEE